MRLRDLPLKKKLAISFGVILVIMGAANGFAVFRMNALKNEFNQITQEWLPTTSSIATIGRSTSLLRMSQLQYTFAPTDTMRNRLALRQVELIDTIEQSQDVLQPLVNDTDKQQLYDRYDALWEAYIELGYKFLERSLAGQRREALVILNVDGEPVFNDLVEALSGLIGSIQQDALQAAADADQSFHKTRNIVRVLFLVTLAMSIFMAGGLVRWITVPMRQLAEASESVATGNLDVHVDMDSTDEIGQLAGAFNRMTGSLAEARDRIVKQQGELEAANETLGQKNSDLEEAMAQLKEAQQQLVMSEKMASLGNLVAGVAHEINNPVGAVRSAADTSVRSVDIVRKQLEASDDIDTLRADKRFQTALEILGSNNDITVTASERITTIVQSLKNFARLDESEFQEADIHEGLDSTLTLLHHEIKRRIEVVKEYGDDIPRIQCYPNQLNQVFMNLLSNASHAIDGEGRITIRTRAAGDNVVIELEDTGRGISKENVAKVFDPGFTTKGVGVGTGLGLSITYNIVQKHNGRIEVESEPGRGTTMRLTFPVSQQGTST